MAMQTEQWLSDLSKRVHEVEVLLDQKSLDKRVDGLYECIQSINRTNQHQTDMLTTHLDLLKSLDKRVKEAENATETFRDFVTKSNIRIGRLEAASEVDKLRIVNLERMVCDLENSWPQHPLSQSWSIVSLVVFVITCLVLIFK